MSSKPLYRVIFVAQGKQYELYARKVSPGALLGFVEVEGLVFGERSSVVLDPSEERLKTEFADVKRFHVPMHAVQRIDEVIKQGSARITVIEGGAGAPSVSILTPPAKR